MSSMLRLLVVAASAPDSSLRCAPATSRAPHPPGPGLPRHAPSVVDLDGCHGPTLEVGSAAPTRTRWRARRRGRTSVMVFTRLRAFNG